VYYSAWNSVQISHLLRSRAGATGIAGMAMAIQYLRGKNGIAGILTTGA